MEYDDDDFAIGPSSTIKTQQIFPIIALNSTGSTAINWAALTAPIAAAINNISAALVKQAFN